MPDKYSKMDDLAGFGFLVNALGGKDSFGKDAGQSFPFSDAEDLSRGARFIPEEVTLARRDGKKVQFVADCSNPCCWYWAMPNRDKIYHFDPLVFDQLTEGEIETCECGNQHFNGGTVKAGE